MPTRTDIKIIADLENLEVLVVRDVFMQVQKMRFQSLVIKTRNMTLSLIRDGLSLSELRSFALPLQALWFKEFRSFYVQAFELGFTKKLRSPTNNLRLLADLAAMSFISRIERDLKDVWVRTEQNKKALVNVTKEVFNAIS